MVAGRYLAVEMGANQHRLELPAAALGLLPPPTYTELTFGPTRRGWTVRALAGRAQADDVGRWLRSLGAEGVQAVAGKEPAVKATLARLPDCLAHAAALVDVERVGLGSDGSAFLHARAGRSRFEELVRHLEALRVPENAVPEITARQAELLQFCKDKGYYEIPRQVTLRGLAKDLGISPTALSLALRRAEARILSAYVERLRHNLPRKAPAKRVRRADGRAH